MYRVFFALLIAGAVSACQGEVRPQSGGMVSVFRGEVPITGALVYESQ